MPASSSSQAGLRSPASSATVRSTDAEALAPQSLRASLRNRAAAIATRYGDSS